MRRRLQLAHGSRCLGLDRQRAKRYLRSLDLQVTDPHHCSPRVHLATLAPQILTRLFYTAGKERTLKNLMSTIHLPKGVLRCRNSHPRRYRTMKIEGTTLLDVPNSLRLQSSQNLCSSALVLRTAVPTPEKLLNRRCQGHSDLSVRHLTWSQVGLHILRRPHPHGCVPRNPGRRRRRLFLADSTVLQVVKTITCHPSLMFPPLSGRRVGGLRVLVQSKERTTVHR